MCKNSAMIKESLLCRVGPDHVTGGAGGLHKYFGKVEANKKRQRTAAVVLPLNL